MFGHLKLILKRSKPFSLRGLGDCERQSINLFSFVSTVTIRQSRLKTLATWKSQEITGCHDDIAQRAHARIREVSDGTWVQPVVAAEVGFFLGLFLLNEAMTLLNAII